MKNHKYLSIILIMILFVGSCKQEPIIPGPAQPKILTPNTTIPTKGSADFAKFIAIGNSFVAGMQGGALFNDGQNNSLPAIMNKQFQLVGAPALFNQPSIKATLGWNLFISQPLLPTGLPPDFTKPVLGRLLLQYGANKVTCGTTTISPTPTPQAYAVGNLEALPNPTVNAAFPYGSNGSLKPQLNNFGIPAITLGQALTPLTGNWGGTTNPAFNPFYARLAFPGTGTATILGLTPTTGDVAAAGGTFFMFWLGLDDFFLYAAFGGNNDLSTPASTRPPLTSTAAFGGQYAAAMGNLLASNANLKGVIANFPDIFAMPHFTAVSYKPIPLDAATASVVSTGFAGYNAVLSGLIANAAGFGISSTLAAEIGTRKVNFSAKCDNSILITDETLTDLGPYFDILAGIPPSSGGITAPQRAALTPYQQVRQTTSADIIPLATGAILGTLINNDPTLVNGVSVPLGDRYALIPSEITAINAARTAFNATVATTAAANPVRLALADVDAALKSLVTGKVAVYNGVTITPNINPPTGIYSEDGVHPNTRGYAFLSNVFIAAINEKFFATIPLTDISLYQATGLPIP